LTASEFVYEKCVLTAIQALDSKDSELCDHSVHVAITATDIARQMREGSFSSSLPDTRDIFIAGIIHDIGKLFVDDSILTKKSNLDTQEHEIVRQHTQCGFSLLSTDEELCHLAPYALQHHERPGKKGYPLHLDTDDIMPTSRIINIADRFTGMLVDRPYRKAIPVEQILPDLIEDIDDFFGDHAPDIIDTLLSTDKSALECAANSYLMSMGITRQSEQSLITP